MGKSPVLQGPRITLRPPRPDDVKGRMALGRDPEVARMFGAILPGPLPVTEEEAADWLDHLALQEHGWMIELDGRLIGSVFLHGFDPVDRRARLALGILAGDCLGQGLGREVVRLVLGQAFGALGLHRVDVRVLDFNERARRCYLACGFVEEGRERQSARVGETWHDDIIMGVLAQEFAGDGVGAPQA